jgi:DNA-binding response OmpR family regulator
VILDREDYMPPLKVLMADDEEDILRIMALKVKAAGYEVLTAADGQEAFNKICREDPDVVLLDLNMPFKDGFQVLKEMRENPPSKKWVPVIIVSARRELQDMHKGYLLEADHYITKPCKIEDILKAIQLVIRLIPQRKVE